MSETDYVTWKERCLTCAYRAGTEASRSEVTLLKAQLCLESGDPFMCHADPNRIALCKGWVDALAVRIRKPREADPERERIAEALADLICDAEDAVLASQHDEAKRLYDAANAAID